MKLIFQFSLLFLFCTTALSQGFQRDTIRGYPFEFAMSDPLKVRKYVLQNGLTVFISPNSDSPRIYSCIAIKAGSKHDPKNNTGLAHYLEHMLFKGTDRYGTRDYEKEKVYLDKINELYERYNRTKDEAKRTKIYGMIDSVSQLASKFAIANEFDKMMQHLGAKGTNAYTSFDETVYITDIPSNQFDTWIQLEAERFRNPVLRLFHTELEAVYEEKNISLDSDQDKVFEALFRGLFQNHTYGTQTTIGTIEHLKNPSLEAIRNYFKKYYVPNNMAIVLAGNIDPDDAIQKIDKAFKAYEPKPVVDLTFKPEVSDTVSSLFEVVGPEPPNVTVGFRLPAPQGTDRLKLTILQELLYNGKSGLIDINLVAKQKLLSASAFVYTLHDASVIYVSAEPGEKQSLEEAKKLLLAQFDSLRRGKFSSELLNAVTLNIETRNARAYESNSSRAFEITEAFTKGISWADITADRLALRKITKEEMILFARKYLNKDFVVVFKNQGEDPNVAKIDKPKITPIVVNRESASRFAKGVYDSDSKALQPEFIPFQGKVKQTTLREGVELHHVKSTQNNLFKLQYIFEFGRFADKRLELAIEYLKLAGTPTMSVDQYGLELYKLASDINMYVGSRTTTFELSGPSASFESALTILENWVTQVQENKAVLASLVSNLLQDRANALANKNIVAGALRNYALYGEDNPTNFMLTNKQLKRIKASELAAFIRGLFAQAHVVNYYGTLEIEEVQKKLNNIHKASTQTPERLVNRIFTPLANNEKKVFFTDFNMVQSDIYWTKPVERTDTTAMATMRLFNEYFDGNMSAIVFQDIRESKALAYSCYARYNQAEQVGLPSFITAFVGTQADKFDSAVVAMENLLRKMPESERLIEASKSSLKSLIESERISEKDWASYILNQRRAGYSSDTRKSVYSRLDATGIKEISAFHQKYFAPEQSYRVCVVGSEKRLSNEQLQRYGKLKVVPVKKLFAF